MIRGLEGWMLKGKRCGEGRRAVDGGQRTEDRRLRTETLILNS